MVIQRQLKTQREVVEDLVVTARLAALVGELLLEAVLIVLLALVCLHFSSELKVLLLLC